MENDQVDCSRQRGNCNGVYFPPSRLRVEEEGEASGEEEISSWRQFEGFKEVGVLKDCIRGNHMDMGEFQKYLDQHCLGWVFNELFGIDRT